MRGINKLILVGNVGRDPEVRSLSGDRKVATFSVATSESWKDKSSGERKERTHWHNIAVFNQALVGIVERYVRKGSRVYVEGASQSRVYKDKNGDEKYITECVLGDFRGDIQLLDKAEGRPGASSPEDYGTTKSLGEHFKEGPGASQPGNAYAAMREGDTVYNPQNGLHEELDDEIPF